jgi:hypothetical protein
VYARRVDPSALVLVFHHTDTHIYVLYLALALSLNNKQDFITYFKEYPLDGKLRFGDCIKRERRTQSFLIRSTIHSQGYHFDDNRCTPRTNSREEDEYCGEERQRRGACTT